MRICNCVFSSIENQMININDFIAMKTNKIVNTSNKFSYNEPIKYLINRMCRQS